MVKQRRIEKKLKVPREQRKEIENPEGTRKTPEEGGQNMAHEEQPQGRQDQRPEEGARDQWRVDTKAGKLSKR